MTPRISVNPELLQWACERSGIAQGGSHSEIQEAAGMGERRDAAHPQAGGGRSRAPSVCRSATCSSRSPRRSLSPSPDFRTFAGQAVTRPSPNLLDTIYTCQERQSWYRDFVRVARQPELGFVGSAKVETPPESVAAEMRETLGFDLAARRDCPTWTDAPAPVHPPGRRGRYPRHGQRGCDEQQPPRPRSCRVSRLCAVPIPSRR